jgi:serine/threonine protein kinase
LDRTNFSSASAPAEWAKFWKARDRLLDRLVALKFLSKQDTRHDLLSEARAASALNHPNIVTIFQIGEIEGEPYLAMEFIEGESLRRYVNATGDLSEALEITEQIVDGLASAHALGIIHRDLKPENIMIRADGQVKLVDFGLAKRLFPSDATTAETAKPASASGELVGTFSYMSPEQARGHAIGRSSDVFSLGIVMYELFSGRHPFRRDEMLETLNAIVKHEPPPLAKERPEAPPRVGDIVSKSLKKEPSERCSDRGPVSPRARIRRSRTPSSDRRYSVEQ